MKVCLRCRIAKVLSDFCMDRSQEDSHHPYCRSCVAERNKIRRQSRQQYDDVHRKKCHPARPIWFMEIKPRDKVLLAIKRGAKDQQAIRSLTRLHIDEICDSLADLYIEDKLDRTALKRREYRMAA